MFHRLSQARELATQLRGTCRWVKGRPGVISRRRHRNRRRAHRAGFLRVSRFEISRHSQHGRWGSSFRCIDGRIVTDDSRCGRTCNVARSGRGCGRDKECSATSGGHGSDQHGSSAAFRHRNRNHCSRPGASPGTHGHRIGDSRTGLLAGRSCASAPRTGRGTQAGCPGYSSRRGSGRRSKTHCNSSGCNSSRRQPTCCGPTHYPGRGSSKSGANHPGRNRQRRSKAKLLRYLRFSIPRAWRATAMQRAASISAFIARFSCR